MKTLKLIVALSLGALVTACSSVPDIASRNVPFEMDSNSFAAQPAMTPTMDAGDMHIAQVNVNAPRSLTVSEANTFYPRGDNRSKRSLTMPFTMAPATWPGPPA